MQKIRKKYWTVKAVGLEHMHAHTNESEFIGSFRSLKTYGEPKTLETVNLGPKKALNGQNFAISEFSRHIEYDFLKEDHNNNFHTKN